MIVILYGGDLATNEMARALYWAAEYKVLQADRVFARIRRAERLRGIAGLLGLASVKIVDEAEMDAQRDGVGSAGRRMVSIDTIVGAIDPAHGTFGPVPALKRRWKPAWRRLWAVEDLDSLPAFPVVRGVDGWYLTDLPRSVLILQLLRAKGAREARITPAVESPGEDARCIDIGTVGEGREASGRGYGYGRQDESKAV